MPDIDTETILRRQQEEIAGLSEEMAALKAELNVSYNRERSTAADIQRLESQLSVARANFQEEEQRVPKLEAELQQARQQLEEQEAELNRLTLEIYNTYEELNLLYDLGKSTTLDLAELYHAFEDRVRLTLDVEEGCLVVTNEGTVDVVSSWGRVKHVPAWQEFCRLLSKEITQRNDPVLINDFVAARESHWRTRLSPELFERLHRMHNLGEIRNLLAVPLRAEKVTMGTVVLMNRLGAGDVFLARDQKLLMALARQTSMAIETAHLSQRLVRQRRMERELEIASNIQASLLPTNPPRMPGIEVAGRCQPANEVGGDYFDYILSESGLGVSCGDVMGKGVPAALVMAMTHSALRSAARDNPMPGRLLNTVNNIMYEDCDRIETNLTLCYAFMDPAKGIMYFSNAGHLSPVIWRAANAEVEYLRTPDGVGDYSDTMIGVLPEATFYESKTPLQPGDVVVLYTDGVTEAVDQVGEYYGEQRLEVVLRDHAQDPVDAIVDEIFKSVNHYARGLPQADDITVVVFKAINRSH